MAFNINPAVVGVIGILIGALASAYINNKLNAKKSKEEFIFKKKTEYFEKIIESLENNLKLYHNLMEKVSDSSKKEIKQMGKRLKSERKNFKISISPIYLKTNIIRNKILRFVSIEKDIFLNFSKIEKEQNTEKKELKVLKLKKEFEELRNIANKIVYEMRKQLYT